jgi:TolA-binding protein
MEVRKLIAAALLIASSANAQERKYEGPAVPPGMRPPAWDKVTYPDTDATTGRPIDPNTVPSAEALVKSGGKAGTNILPDERLRLIAEKEKLVVVKRQEAISLLEELLRSRPGREATGEALFKLAELYWEDSRLRYVLAMQRYDQLTDACRKTDKTPEIASQCEKQPPPPILDTSRSEKLYVRLSEEFPDYKRIDIVLYLLGFSAREEGRSDEALVWFEKLIAEKPESPLLPDAWMMIGEYYFDTDFAKARTAYLKVLEHKDSPVYDLALFKTAWCDWKLGDTKSAAERFKEVLDLATAAEKSGSDAAKRRSSQLRDEALNYLTLLFTEDESITAKDAYEFLANIGGERYSRDVLVRLADLFYAQSRYDRATEAWEFLTQLDPVHPDAPKFQLKIVEAYVAVDDLGRAIQSAKKLADSYGPKSDWAKANKDRKTTMAEITSAIEEALANLATRLHAEAQADEKRAKRPDLPRYNRATEVYALYLGRFPSSKRAIEMRFLRAEILYFKLGQNELAGDEYLAVGKTPPGNTPRHKDALLKAMAAYEKLRPKNVTGKREPTPSDRKFASAVALYAKNFPADKDVVGVIFRNGQMFFDYGEWDEAVKQFGIIVSKYPDDENAGAAGDRILEALAKGEDHETIEEWAKTLKKARSFQTPAEQKRLDEIIVQAIGKQAEDKIKKGEIEEAAKIYMRAADEYPNDKRAPESYQKAAAVLESAQQPTKAAEIYLKLVQKYPKTPQAPAAAFNAGKAYEGQAYFDKASEAYQIVAYKYQSDAKAPDALFNIGVIEQALGNPKAAVRANLEYAKRYPKRDDVRDVYFRIGIVYADDGEHEKAANAFKDFVRKYDDSPRVVEATTRAARSYIALKSERRANEELVKALRRYKSLSKKQQEEQARWAAEARYLQGEAVFLEYQAIGLNVKPERLEKVLGQKKDLLRKAENIYIDVVSYGDPTWAAAGLFRMGQSYEQFAEQLRNTPVPNELSDDEKQVYKEQLDIFIVDIEDKSISIYDSGYKKAIELKVYGEYTRKLREGLGRLSPNKFPPEREARAHSRVGDKPPEVTYVKDVREGE